MEDQFGGRTDDDLFSDDFEPVPQSQTVSVPISDSPVHTLQVATSVVNITAAPPSPPPEPAPSVPTPRHEASDGRIPPATGVDSTPSPVTHTSVSAPRQPRHVANNQASQPPPPRPINRSMLNSRFAPKNQAARAQLDTQQHHESQNQPQQSHNRDQGRGAKRQAKKASRDAAATIATTIPAAGANNNNHNIRSAAPPPTAPTPSQEGQEVSATGSGPAPPKPAAHANAGARLGPDTRLGSGGAPRTKLTEEELSVKMEEMRLLNQQRARRHEEAAQDEKAHAEAVARGLEQARKKKAADAERRKRGEEERTKLEEEREKNRARKLKAMGMKEGGWDAGKEDLMDNQMEGTRKTFGGAHGGVRGSRGQGLAGSRFANPSGVVAEENAPRVDATGEGEFSTSRGRGRGRGRGGRGRGRGRGGGGGGGGFEQMGDIDRDHHTHNVNGHHRHNSDAPSSSSSRTAPKHQPARPKLETDEFPALPNTSKPQEESSKSTITTPATPPKPEGVVKSVIPRFADLGPLSPLSPIGKWDEEVEMSAAAARK